MKDYWLLTGATGLLGQYLLRDLTDAGHRLAVVVRPSQTQSAAERIDDLFRRWEAAGEATRPRPAVLNGDVSQPGLGLSADDRAWVARHCTRMIHSAAALVFHGADRAGEPWRTNLDGTRYVVDLCRDTEIRDFHYISTAYVCGTRPGPILEDELDCGQSFRNEYEESKFLAEKLVREADCFDSPTVYRPAVIAGDARTGFTSTYHGLYMYLQLITVLCRNVEPDADGVRRISVRLDMTGDERRNVVPVDWVSAATCRLLDLPAARGGTFHLAPDEPITPRQVIELITRKLNVVGVQYGHAEAPDLGEMNAVERAAYENKTMYRNYEQSDPLFDMRNLKRLAPDLPSPPIDDAMLERFWQFAEADNWGRRRRKRAKVGT